MHVDASLLLAGYGKMGSALLTGWQKKGLTFNELVVAEPTGLSSSFSGAATWIRSVDEKDPSFSPDIILLAVKPQTLPALLPVYAARFPRALYISIAAGKTLSFFQKHLGQQAPIVRAMPNTPALIGKGITAAYASGSVSTVQKQQATALLEAVGSLTWLDQEALMDAITAVSGSGPAYVFYFMEAFINAAMRAGIPEALAKELVFKTLHGSIHLAETSTEPLATLRQNVTSPGGTTEAALSIFMRGDGLGKLFDEAVQSAMARSRELAE